MLSICIVPLQQEYEIKDIKVQTFKLKHDGTSTKETFDVEKSDGTIIEMMFNTILLFKECQIKCNSQVLWCFPILTSVKLNMQ